MSRPMSACTSEEIAQSAAGSQTAKASSPASSESRTEHQSCWSDDRRKRQRTKPLAVTSGKKTPTVVSRVQRRCAGDHVHPGAETSPKSPLVQALVTGRVGPSPNRTKKRRPREVAHGLLTRTSRTWPRHSELSMIACREAFSRPPSANGRGHPAAGSHACRCCRPAESSGLRQLDSWTGGRLGALLDTRLRQDRKRCAVRRLSSAARTVRHRPS